MCETLHQTERDWQTCDICMQPLCSTIQRLANSYGRRNGSDDLLKKIDSLLKHAKSRFYAVLPHDAPFSFIILLFGFATLKVMLVEDRFLRQMGFKRR
jgi:hypothetical protein